MSLSNQAKVVLQMAPPLFRAILAEMKIAPYFCHRLNKTIFFYKTGLSMHSLWLPGGLAPPCHVISSGRKSLYERHTASTGAYSVKLATLSSARERFAL